MKKLIIIALASLFFSGCRTMESKIQKLTDIASRVDSVEYRHSGFWSDGTMTVDSNADGSRDLSSEIRAKVPGGPSMILKVNGIQPTEDNE